MSRFVCPNWRNGQACRPFFHTHWTSRWVASLFGSTIAVLAPGINLMISLGAKPPDPAILPLVWGFAAVYAVGWLAGIVFALNNEHDFFGSLVAGFGIPGLFVILAQLPHIG